LELLSEWFQVHVNTMDRALVAAVGISGRHAIPEGIRLKNDAQRIWGNIGS
jgi:hypothetical protein